MFGFKKEMSKIFATQDGDCVELAKVPDPVFSDKLLGDGAAIIPESNLVRSPVDGKIEQVFDTLHAYSILSDDGLEILVHIGLNTVELKGEGFKAMVKNGDKLKKGDILCEVNLDFLRENGYEIYTPVIITNMDKIKNLKVNCGRAKSGETTIIEYSL